MRRRAITRSTVQPQIAALFLGRYLAGTSRIQRRLIGKNRRNSHRLRFLAHRHIRKSMVFPQTPPHLMQQSIFPGKRQIAHLNPRRIPPPPRTPASRHRDLSPSAFRQQQGLVPERIDRIHHPVHISPQHLLHRALRKKSLDHLDLTSRMDRPHPLQHRRRLLLTNLPVHRVKLPVHIAQTNLIQIHHPDLANPGSRQRLHRP